MLKDLVNAYSTLWPAGREGSSRVRDGWHVRMLDF